MTRVCKKCGLEKPLYEFYKHECGHRYECKACLAQRSSVWAKENPDRRKKIVRDSRGNPDNAWKSYRTEWRKGSGEVAKRRAAIGKRIPAWVSEDDLWLIREIYSLRALRQKLTGLKWHVDHIVPLRGLTVSGLHVPNNLQVILESENLLKSNTLSEI